MSAPLESSLQEGTLGCSFVAQGDPLFLAAAAQEQGAVLLGQCRTAPTAKPWLQEHPEAAL